MARSSKSGSKGGGTRARSSARSRAGSKTRKTRKKAKTTPRKKQRVYRRFAPGLAPGTITVDPESPFPTIRFIGYDAERTIEQEVKPAEIPALLAEWPKAWIQVAGLGDEATLLELASVFSLHPLALEDVVNVGQRPKVEPYEHAVFIIVQIPTEEGEDTQQLSLFLTESYVLTFQEHPTGCLEPVRVRIMEGQGKVRSGGLDYLAYCLIDAVIDAYFPIVEQIGEELVDLEERLLESPDSEIIPDIHRIKRLLVKLRRAVMPHRDALNALMRETESVLTQDTSIYMRDCYDHLVSLGERLEIYFEIESNLLATYLSMVSNRMNEVMKVLTIIATIFIPLSFIAGVYGMNFDADVSGWNMPELRWVLGYPFALFLMAAVALGLVGFFKRKGWFD